MKKTFWGFPAFVGSFSGPATCGFWAEKSHFGKSAFLIPIDLSKRPAKAAISDIQVDDHETDRDTNNHRTGGSTTIGPVFPLGKTMGAVYLEQSFYDAIPASKKPARPPVGFPARDYEFKVVLYEDGPRMGKHYYGFHAVIVKEEPPNKALVAIYPQGSSLERIVDEETGLEHEIDPTIALWLDLASVSVDAHTSNSGETAIACGSSGQKQGALFMEFTVATNLSLQFAKMPRGEDE